MSFAARTQSAAAATGKSLTISTRTLGPPRSTQDRTDDHADSAWPFWRFGAMTFPSPTIACGEGFL